MRLKRSRKPHVPEAPALFFGRPAPTPEQLKAMLRPEWDPTKQYDGSPALIDAPAKIIVPGRLSPAARTPAPTVPTGWRCKACGTTDPHKHGGTEEAHWKAYPSPGDRAVRWLAIACCGIAALTFVGMLWMAFTGR